MKIEWSVRSRIDLQELKNYIGQNSPHYARRFIARIIASVWKGWPTFQILVEKYRKPKKEIMSEN